MAKDTRSFPVLSPIRFGGKTYEPGGGPIELTEELFEQLKGSGAIGLTPIDTAADRLAAERKANERAALIRAAIGKLTEADMTQAGKPKVAAVEKLVGFGVTAAEIEAVITAAT